MTLIYETDELDGEMEDELMNLLHKYRWDPHRTDFQSTKRTLIFEKKDK